MQKAHYRKLAWHWPLQWTGISSLAFPRESTTSSAETRNHRPARRGSHGTNLWSCVQSLEVTNCRVETTEVIIADCHLRTEGTWKLNTQPELRTYPPPPRSSTGHRYNNKPYSCFGVSCCRDASAAFFSSTKLQKKKNYIPDSLFSRMVCFSFTEKAISTLLPLHIPPLFTFWCPSYICLFTAILWQPPARKREESH